MKKFSIIILILSMSLIGCLAQIGIRSQESGLNPPKVNQNSKVYDTPAIIKDWRNDRIVNISDTGSMQLKTQAISSHLKADLSLPTMTTNILNPTVKFEWGKWVSAKSSPGLLLRDTTVLYFLTDNPTGYNVYAVNLSSTTTTVNGSIKWQRTLNGAFNGTSPALVIGGLKNRLYALSNYYDSTSGKYGKLYCLDADTGYTLAEKTIGDAVGFKDSSPWVNPVGASDYIYIASQSGHVYKFTYDTNNSIFTMDYDKTVSTSSRARFSSSPVFRASTGMLYAGMENGNFYEINAGSGDVNYTWDLATGSSVTQNTGARMLGTSVIDDTNGIVLVPCGGYLFRIDITTRGIKQSPLLEFRESVLSLPHEPTGPDKVSAGSTFSSTLSSDAKPPVAKLELESNSGLSVGDYVRVKSKPVYGYGSLVKVADDSGSVDLDVVAGNGLWPTIAPTPNPLSGDTVESAFDVIRYNPAPVSAKVFALGSVANLSDSDFIRVYKDATTAYVGQINAGGINTVTKVVTLVGLGLNGGAYTPTGGEKWEKIYNEIQAVADTTHITLASVENFYVGNTIRIKGQNGYEYSTITNINTTTRVLTLSPQLTTINGLVDKIVDVINVNPYYGRIFSVNNLALGDIKSSPVIMTGVPNRVYIGNNNAIFELDYDNSTNFGNFANYCFTQAGRLDSSNLNLQQAHQASSPKIVTNPNTGTKLLFMLDEDVTKKTGTFINRFNVPIADATGNIIDRLNTFFPVSELSSNGQAVSNNNFPLITTNLITIEDVVKGYWIFYGAGNGIIYGLSLGNAWN